MAKRPSQPPEPPTGKVIPFARPNRAPRMPPRPPVYGSRLEVDAKEAQRVFDEAAESLEQIDIDAELAKWDEAVARGEDQANEARAALLLMRACRALGRGDLDAALRGASEVIEAYPAYADAFGVRASIHVRRGDPPAALADFDRAVELAPRDADRYFKRAGCYEQLGDHDRALANFSRAAQIEPEGSEAHAGVARCALAKGDEAGAIRAYGRAIKYAPRDATLYFMRGLVHEKAERPEQALADYTKSVSLFDNQKDVWMSRGRCRLKLKQNEAAVADFTRVIQMAPQDGHGYRSRADALFGLGRHAEALPDLDHAIALDFDASGASHWLRGRIREMAGDDDDALPDFEEAVRRAPAHVTFLASLFAARCRVEQLEEGLVLLDRLFTLMPVTPALLLTRARLLAKIGRRDDAIADYERVLAADPLNALAVCERAEALFEPGDRSDEARAGFMRAVELAPDDAYIRHAYGENSVLHARTDEEREAGFAHIAASALLDPTDPSGWHRAGDTFHRLGRLAQAVAHFDRAILLHPGAPGAFIARANARERLHDGSGDPVLVEQDLRAAIADYDTAMALCPFEDEDLHALRGRLHELVGDLDRAVADYTKVIAMRPDRRMGYLDRARVRARAGDAEGARADAAQAATMDKDDDEDEDP